MSEEFKMVIVVRNDIKLSPGKMAAQVAHAAVNCALAAKKNYKKYFEGWYDEGQKKVVVKVKSINELRELQFLAKNAGLPNSLITDAGHTQLPPGTVTCLGIGPGPEDDINKITGHLKLD
ncbi:MAG: peptidyl-tRNA hydrolase Pth2 [Thermoplasmata archaeon]|nr:peptidyl-tRNA hydrolase Pth2 [Thermoplasmata archaeon]